MYGLWQLSYRRFNLETHMVLVRIFLIWKCRIMTHKKITRPIKMKGIQKRLQKIYSPYYVQMLSYFIIYPPLYTSITLYHAWLIIVNNHWLWNNHNNITALCYYIIGVISKSVSSCQCNNKRSKLERKKKKKMYELWVVGYCGECCAWQYLNIRMTLHLIFRKKHKMAVFGGIFRLDK